MANKETEKIRQQIHELLDIVLDTNGFECREREKTGALPTMFFNFSGHVNSLNISINQDGWERGAYSDTIIDWSLNHTLPENRIDEFREQCQEALGCKKESEVLARDIEKCKQDMAEAKESLKQMQKKLNKLAKEGR